jgi:hypothetical protein
MDTVIVHFGGGLHMSNWPLEVVTVGETLGPTKTVETGTVGAGINLPAPARLRRTAFSLTRDALSP